MRCCYVIRRYSTILGDWPHVVSLRYRCIRIHYKALKPPKYKHCLGNHFYARTAAGATVTEEGTCSLSELFVVIAAMRHRSRDRSRILFLRDMMLSIGNLWETTQGDPSIWETHGHLYLGLMPGQSRVKKIPNQYKRAIIYETRNHLGRGVTKPAQVLTGLSIAQRIGPTQLMSLKCRLFRKKTLSWNGVQPEPTCGLQAVAGGLNCA